MSKRILIVDNNRDHQKLVSWILEEASYTFVSVETVDACLALLATQTFDLVLMDISLPGSEGKTVTSYIRQHPNLVSTMVVACTVHATSSEANKILASGVDAIITKPIDEAELLGCLRHLMGAHS